MDHFLKRTEHPVSPILPAPKKPTVSLKQGVISASFRVYFYESGGKLFKQLSTTKNYLIEKIRCTFSVHFANIRRTRAALFTKFLLTKEENRATRN